MNQSPITQSDIDDTKSIPYANLVGSLMYDVVCSRPNLAHVMSVVSRYMSNPWLSH